MYLTLSLTAFLVKGEKKKFKENIHAFSVQGKSHSVSVLQKKTFEKVNYVTYKFVQKCLFSIFWQSINLFSL
jgi:hypothetical protein